MQTMKLAALILIASALSLPAQEVLHSFTSVPVPITKPQPEYTKEALDAMLQGSVRLQVTIGIDGTASEIKVAQGLDKGLDQKAIECVQQWRFKPGMRDGVPTATKATIEITFRLPSNPAVK
jgi:protein TonB